MPDWLSFASEAIGENTALDATPAPAASTPPETPAETPAPAPGTREAGVPETPATPPPDPTAAAAPAPGDPAPEAPSEGPFDWKRVPPELAPLAKQLQADYTRKTQALAEQRKAIEGVDPQGIEAVRHLQTLARQDPAQAAAWLEQQAQALRGVPPTPEFRPQTLEGAMLADQLQQVQQQYGQQLSQVQTFIHQQQLARELEAIDRSFDSIGQQIGREIPRPEREAVAAFATEHRIGDVNLAWKCFDYDRATKGAYEKGQTVVQQKAASVPPSPSPIQNRAQPRALPMPASFAEAARRALTEAGV